MRKFCIFYGIILLSFIIGNEQTTNLDDAKKLMNQVNIDGINNKYSNCVIDGLKGKYGTDMVLSEESLKYMSSELSPACEETYGGHKIEKSVFINDQFFSESSTRSISNPNFPIWEDGWSYNDQKYIWDSCMDDFNAYMFCECFLYACQLNWFGSYDNASNFPLIWIGLVGGSMGLMCGEIAPLLWIEFLINNL